jgi:endonuclease III-like uncharacterized protein
MYRPKARRMRAFSSALRVFGNGLNSIKGKMLRRQLSNAEGVVRDLLED